MCEREGSGRVVVWDCEAERWRLVLAGRAVAAVVPVRVVDVDVVDVFVVFEVEMEEE